jgi:ring-1,2-phenylacetyl-CoA epoxidase subunit PaaC
MSERDYVLGRADDALLAAQRLAQWSGRAHDLEEDIALTNIALDQLGVARQFYQSIGDEDELAYRRSDLEFRNCLLVEVPNEPLDFGRTIAMLLFLSAYQLLQYEGPALGDVAAKARVESRYHLDHATQWTLRLGDGTPASRERMQQAVDELWPYTHELFEDVPELRPQWMSTVEDVLARATLTRPADGWAPTGGRHGRHTEHLSYLLGELQVLHRAHPGAVW